MSSFRIFNQRFSRVMAAFALLFAVAMPTLVSAAQLSTRSIELSSSSVSAQNVSYKVKFHAPTAAGATVVEFCANSPLLSESCTPAADFTAAGATTSTPGFTMGTKTATKVIVTGAITADSDVEFVLAAINNPSVAGPLYARIATYTDATTAASYPAVTGSDAKDQGGVAMSITPTIGVSGAVLESMTFCVAKNTISADCNLTGNDAPVLKLGETVGSTVALQPGVTSTGSIYTQISTNASGGAIVSLKSNALGCGGLKRAGAPTACDILPALKTGINAGEAKFGVKAVSVADTGTSPNGELRVYPTSGYNDTTYALNWASGDATGVTSVYGDPFLDTHDAPANNKNMQLTFGAQVNNGTPAGLYSADLSLIATGKF